jgi:hypothetical protein
MRPAALGLLAALLIAPLAAQAAQQPARFAVTLQGRIIDNVSYERLGIPVSEDCTARRTGHGGRELTIRSLRPTTIEVIRGGSRVVYRPARVGRLRVAATRLAGSFLETRLCRFLPPEKRTGTCSRARGPVRRLRAGFRSGRNAIVFRRPAPSRIAITACGLDRSVPGGWLHEVRGRIDQGALLAGRSLRVFARASGTRERTFDTDPLLQRTQRTTVRWTLTFRRLR